MRIDFKEESRVDAVKEFRVVKVRYIAPDDGASPDLAVLEIAGGQVRRLLHAGRRVA